MTTRPSMSSMEDELKGGSNEIKAEGGMVVAQDPDSAEFDGMPRNAIATGLVDYILPPAEMPVT